MCQITLVVLEKDHNGEYKARIVKQILWVNGNKYVLQDIYGIGNKVVDNEEDENERGKECVICLSEPRDDCSPLQAYGKHINILQR